MLLASIHSALPDDASAPEWVHLIPAGTTRGVDGRGPYRLAAPQPVIAASMARRKLPIDENHSTQLSAPRGEPSPARGWIVGMEARADGIWGRVEWTPVGATLMTEKAYRGISPAFHHDKNGVILRLVSASLTNNPNLTDLATLHAELSQAERDQMTPDQFALPATRELPIRDPDHVRLAWDMVDRTAGLSLGEKRQARARILARARQLGIDTRDWSGADHVATHGEIMDPTVLRSALGLPATADEAAILAAVTANAAAVATHAAQLTAIATAAGVTAADGPALALALQAQRAAGGDTAQLVTLQTQLQTLQVERAKERAEAFVDGAIRAGKPIAPARDRYVSRHMADPTGVEADVNALPSIHAGGIDLPSGGGGGANGAPWLSPDERKLAASLKMTPLEYSAQTKAVRAARGETV